MVQGPPPKHGPMPCAHGSHPNMHVMQREGHKDVTEDKTISGFPKLGGQFWGPDEKGILLLGVYFWGPLCS